MAPIDVGVGFEELEKLAKPPLLVDGTYEFIIAKVEDSPVKESSRPQWRFQLQIINRPDIVNRSVFLYAQLPWVDPDTKEWDYTNTFTLVDIMNATGVKMMGKQLPDKEVFFGKNGIMRLGHRTRKGTENDPEPTVDQSVKVITKRKAGNVA